LSPPLNFAPRLALGPLFLLFGRKTLLNVKDFLNR
jgi:hypothetical protein